MESAVDVRRPTEMRVEGKCWTKEDIAGLRGRAMYERGVDCRMRRGVPEIVDRRTFLRLTREGGRQSAFLGRYVEKPSCDLWAYQEAIYSQNVSFVVETGTRGGGSAFYFSTILGLLGHEGRRVVTVDIDTEEDREEDGIVYLGGNSVGLDVVEAAAAAIPEGARVMVSLDSDHEAEHVYREMRLYSPLVSKGCHMVVEDTHHSVETGRPGPKEAADRFLSENRGEWALDPTFDEYGLSQAFGGWLIRT